jgi:hypothetical protein
MSLMMEMVSSGTVPCRTSDFIDEGNDEVWNISM